MRLPKIQAINIYIVTHNVQCEGVSEKNRNKSLATQRLGKRSSKKRRGRGEP